jgi:hypothetical protein
MTKQRKVSHDYIEMFVQTIVAGNPVIFVEDANLLAVDHPEIGYLVLELADKVVDNSKE